MARKPSGKNNQKSQSLPLGYIAVGLLVLGIAYLAWRGRSAQEASLSAIAPVEKPAGSKGPAVQILNDNAPREDMRKYQAELNQQRAQYAQARALGLKSMPLQSSGDTLRIPVVFMPHKIWCQGGDLDTMKYASKDRSSKEFLISLEALGRGGKNPFVRVSLNELYKGVNYTFTLPRPKETTAYGVYICTDSHHENSCQRKGMESHAQLSDELAENPQTRNEDRIFFFQNLVLDGKKVETWRSNDFSLDFQKSISTHLQKKGLSASDVQTAWKSNTTLKSAPADVSNGKIVFSLPYNDPRCTQSASGPAPVKQR